MDRMYIRDLSLRCIIGTKPEERLKKQEVIVNVGLDCDLSVAGRSDDLADTINYSRLKQGIADLVEDSRFQLIEKLAQRIAELCLKDEKVLGVTVTVDKPRALRFARSAAVEIYRPRPER
jgi:D-erythro-7,8-dihydroneopterin triphosphate epimerase